MASGSGAHGAALTVARWALASLFVVLGGWRIWGALNGASLSNVALLLSVCELLLGVLILAGWRLRWTALAAVALLVIDAVLSHPFWAMRAGARDVQLLHFMKNIGLVGGIPEPATWAMMILGFGVVGGAMRAGGAARRSGVRFA